MKHVQKVWFHGTNWRNAQKIEREGFRPGTWFVEAHGGRHGVRRLLHLLGARDFR